MPLIPFPNIPKLPGVPQLNRSLQFPAGPPPALSGVIALGRLALALLQQPKWGIYANDPPRVDDAGDDGLQTVTVQSRATPVVIPDSIRTFDYSNEWNVADFPIEQGGFASYDKVNNPFEVTLRLTKGGSLRGRTDFIAQIEAIAGSLSLYKILTPEKTYLNCNVISWKMRRQEQQGAYFLAEVDITFREIRFVVAEYTTTAANTQDAKEPAAQGPTNIGSVAATTAPPAVVTSAEGV